MLPVCTPHSKRTAFLLTAAPHHRYPFLAYPLPLLYGQMLESLSEIQVATKLLKRGKAATSNPLYRLHLPISALLPSQIAPTGATGGVPSQQSFSLGSPPILLYHPP